MKDTAKQFCSVLFDVLEAHGVRRLVCSPGSRNVPLLIAAAARQDIRKYFVVDERSAGFVGMGISTVSKEPVALVCTSGTALLNYAPSVAEAYYQGLPLIVISADRPVQWIDQDDSQTLRQDEALQNFVKKSYSVPAYGDDDKELMWYVNRIVNDAVNVATTGKPGPVHINVHLGEPLNKKIERTCSDPRVIKTIEADAIANKETIRQLASELATSKVMLVAGFGPPDANLQKSVAEFSKWPNVTVMAETISNLHLHTEDFSVDSVLTAYSTEELDRFSPDIVISIGGSLVSRKLKEYLRRNSDRIRHWSVGYSHTTSDPFMSLTLRIETEPSRFFRNVNAVLRKLIKKGKTSEYQKEWRELREAALLVKTHYVEKCEWSELKAFDYILHHLPGNYNLFLSNGTPVRYAQIIPYALPHASYCNRGVSGIDGSVSTAIGGAMEFKGNTLLVTGDLSMAYDVGALGLKQVPERFKIIVMDNQGGGIFRFIPATSNLEEREEYLCQAPDLPVKSLAEGYGWKYFECNSMEELDSNLGNFLSYEGKSIMKIVCDGERSADILKGYMNQRL